MYVERNDGPLVDDLQVEVPRNAIGRSSDLNRHEIRAGAPVVTGPRRAGPGKVAHAGIRERHQDVLCLIVRKHGPAQQDQPQCACADQRHVILRFQRAPQTGPDYRRAFAG